MQFTVASVLALAATASATYASNVTYTTEIVTAVTTYCPAATQISFNGQTYSVTEVRTDP
jgi:polyisoprenoid-binding protein YceI